MPAPLSAAARWAMARIPQPDLSGCGAGHGSSLRVRGFCPAPPPPRREPRELWMVRRRSTVRFRKGAPPQVRGFFRLGTGDLFSGCSWGGRRSALCPPKDLQVRGGLDAGLTGSDVQPGAPWGARSLRGPFASPPRTPFYPPQTEESGNLLGRVFEGAVTLPVRRTRRVVRSGNRSRQSWTCQDRQMALSGKRNGEAYKRNPWSDRVTSPRVLAVDLAP
jgi:hypothetical protein